MSGGGGGGGCGVGGSGVCEMTEIHVGAKIGKLGGVEEENKAAYESMSVPGRRKDGPTDEMANHRRTGSETFVTSPLNSKSDGNLSQIQMSSILGLQRALESLM